MIIPLQATCRSKEYLYLCVPIIGRVAEWLGRGLQNLVQRFESARDLSKSTYESEYFFFALCAPGPTLSCLPITPPIPELLAKKAPADCWRFYLVGWSSVIRGLLLSFHFLFQLSKCVDVTKGRLLSLRRDFC